jgi:hypothetical protein
VPSSLWLLIVLALIGWFWLDSLRAREVAVGVGKAACRKYGLQFLDDSVALAALRVGRSPRGGLRLRRRFRFEYSWTGDERSEGYVTLIGQDLEQVRLEPHGPPPAERIT